MEKAQWNRLWDKDAIILIPLKTTVVQVQSYQ